MRSLLLVIALVVLGTEAAHAGDFCVRGISRGKVIDFDMKNADLHDVYRLLADVGNVNIVLGDTVKGKVTMRLRRVPWDKVACTIAAMHQLTITVDGAVLLVVPATRPATEHVAAVRRRR